MDYRRPDDQAARPVDGHLVRARAGWLGGGMNNRHVVLAGWVLFTLSAIGYIIASVGNFWSMFGSVCFLVACLVFLVAHFREDTD